MINVYLNRWRLFFCSNSSNMSRVMYMGISRTGDYILIKRKYVLGLEMTLKASHSRGIGVTAIIVGLDPSDPGSTPGYPLFPTRKGTHSNLLMHKLPILRLYSVP